MMLQRLDPRPAQLSILEYSQGWMGISAVPGSGKTHTLSALAAQLLVDERLAPEQEVLVVTLVNSAVRNFSQRIAWFIEGEGLLPDLGYRVRTLHGLANDILRERPDLAGLSDRFQILDEREGEQIMKDVSLNWLKAHPQFIDAYLNPEIDDSKVNSIRQQFPGLISTIAGAFIRIAKDQQTTPQLLSQKLAALSRPPLLLQMGCEIFSDYQRALAYRSAVDFDDLIRLALQVLQTDPDYLTRLRYRWPYILEDEAQDSSRLQEEILKLLAGPEGNWVRVGDPNQAIYETFTTANPHYLLDFKKLPGVTSLSLPNSGRSSQSILRLANYLIDWTREEHPHEELRDALNPPHILPVPPGDPQPNPEDNPDGIYLSHIKYTPEEEVAAVVKSLRRWLPEHPDQTVAVLTPRNERGNEVVAALKKAGIEPIELLRSSLSTRQTADLLATILRYLSDPASTQKLCAVYRLLREDASRQAAKSAKEESSNQENLASLHQTSSPSSSPNLRASVVKDFSAITQSTAALLSHCAHLEEYLLPTPEHDWLFELSDEDAPPAVRQELEILRVLILPWQKATVLPVDQLLLTIAQDIFERPTELALAHKLALVLETMAQNHPDWHLPEFCEELAVVARNERKFLGFAEEDAGFDPNEHKGKVVVATIHKAKGLEWDRVYLMSVNNYDFPSLDFSDTYYSEKWFVRDHLNLEAETLLLLQGLIADDPALIAIEEGFATRESRQEYAAERLRLLFVGITRARRELTITWNSGRRGDCTPAYPLLEMQRWWEENG
jgi:DNA helicase-2/ATP-dependent DNA helicase PcrA